MITKKQFLTVYNRHSPNYFILFVFKHFNSDIKKKPIGTISCLICFLIASVGLLIIPELFVWFYIGFALLLITLPAHICNNIRIANICHELGIRKYEYNIYADIYGVE